MKRILAMAISVVLVATMAIGSSIAYLQDSDSEVNVMTMGSVYIDQIEQQRVQNADGTLGPELEKFKDGKDMLPAVYESETSGDYNNPKSYGGSVNVNGTDYTIFGEDIVKNAIDKIVTVENTGKSDAYIRTIFAFEHTDPNGDKEYDDGIAWKLHTTYNAADGEWATYAGDPLDNVEINGTLYSIASYTYTEALAGGDTSAPSLLQVFFDKSVTNEDIEATGDQYDILVLSQAIQAEGFADAETALNDGFGVINEENVKAWFTGLNAWDGEADTGWYDETTTSYEIWNADELAGLAQLANAGNNFAGKTVELMDDVDLGGKTWTPIKSFAGEFDGNGNTISNFQIDATEARGGFFNVIEAGEGERVHDLTIENVKATVGNSRFGTLANSVQGIVNRVTVKDVEVETTHSDAWVGGMCAFMSWPWMNDCTVENMVVDASEGAEFVCGFAAILQKNSNMIFDNNDVKGFKVTVNDTDGSCGVAGFAGQTQRGWENPKIINSDITGIDITATGTVDVGGFIAWPGAHTIAENCTVEGKIDASGVTSADNFAGGFFGNLGWNADLGQMGHKVSNCTADVDIITSIAPAGGFIGSATNSNNNSMYAEFTKCAAKGDVTSTGAAPVGGFAGDADRGKYTECTASGKVTGSNISAAGQFIGSIVDVTPKYDHRYPAGTRDYLVDQIFITDCTSGIGNTESGANVTIV